MIVRLSLAVNSSEAPKALAFPQASSACHVHDRIGDGHHDREDLAVGQPPATCVATTRCGRTDVSRNLAEAPGIRVHACCMAGGRDGCPIGESPWPRRLSVNPGPAVEDPHGVSQSLAHALKARQRRPPPKELNKDCFRKVLEDEHLLG